MALKTPEGRKSEWLDQFPRCLLHIHVGGPREYPYPTMERIFGKFSGAGVEVNGLENSRGKEE